MELSINKTQVASSTPGTEAKEKTYGAEREGRQGDYLIGYSLSGCIIWENLIGYL